MIADFSGASPILKKTSIPVNSLSDQEINELKERFNKYNILRSEINDFINSIASEEDEFSVPLEHMDTFYSLFKAECDNLEQLIYLLEKTTEKEDSK